MAKDKKETKEKRETFVVEIGPLLKKVLDDQKDNIKEATYGCVKPSHYEVGEIIAKKIMQQGGIKIVKENLV